MAVELIRDPRTRKEVTFISGKVDGVFFNELKQQKTYAGPNGPWTPTHSASIVVDGDRVSFGLTDKQKINSKDADGNYHELTRGMEVSVEITEVGEYNGKPTYNSKASRVTVLDVSGAQQPQQSSGGGKQQSFQKKDDTPIIAGNARTAATTFASRIETDESLEDLITFFAKVSHDARLIVSENHTEMDTFTVGVSVGQATVAAAQMVDDLDDVEEFILNYVDTLVPHSIAVVKGLSEKKEDKVEKKSSGKKTASKKTTPKKQEEDQPEFEDDQDQVPF